MADRKQQSGRQTLLGIVGLVVIVGAAVGLFLAARQLSADVLAALLTGVFTVSGLVWNRRQERAQAIALELREQKAPVYMEFMNFWFETLLNKQLGKPEKSEQDIQRYLATFTKDLITWGSDDMLRQYAAFRAMGGDSTEPVAMMYQFAEILLAIRRDLGHDNKGISAGDLLSLFITDWAEFSSGLAPQAVTP